MHGVIARARRIQLTVDNLVAAQLERDPRRRDLAVENCLRRRVQRDHRRVQHGGADCESRSELGQPDQRCRVPRGALALVQKVTNFLDLKVDELPLSKAAADYEERISALVASDPNLAEYVKELKRREFAQ